LFCAGLAPLTGEKESEWRLWDSIQSHNVLVGTLLHVSQERSPIIAVVNRKHYDTVKSLRPGVVSKLAPGILSESIHYIKMDTVYDVSGVYGYGVWVEPGTMHSVVVVVARRRDTLEENQGFPPGEKTECLFHKSILAQGTFPFGSWIALDFDCLHPHTTTLYQGLESTWMFQNLCFGQSSDSRYDHCSGNSGNLIRVTGWYGIKYSEEVHFYELKKVDREETSFGLWLTNITKRGY